MLYSKMFLSVFLSITFVSCSGSINVEFLDEDPFSNESSTRFDSAPVASDITPANGTEDIESIISLSYVDANSDKATSCSGSGLSNITITTACSCDGAGVCTIGITGTLDYSGAGSLKYTVTANSKISNSASMNFTIDPVADQFYSTNFDTALDWTVSGDASWECGDQTNDSFGPPSGHSGNSVCGTNLNANYTVVNGNAFIQSPIITLSNAQAPVVSFWLDSEIEVSSCGGDYECDGLAIYISVNSGPFISLGYKDGGIRGLLPEGYLIQSGGSGLAGWSNHQPVGEWAKVELDLFNMETVGLTAIISDDTIVVRFGLHTDMGVHGAGVYIDDFSVDDPLTPTAKTLPYTQNFDSVDGWFASGGGNVWEIGNQTNATFGPSSGVSGNTVAATTLNGEYLITGTTKHLNTFLNTPAFSLYGSSNPTISFSMYLDSTAYDGANVQISVNGGEFVTVEFGDGGLTGLTYTNNGNIAGLDGWSGTIGWSAVNIELLSLTTTGLTMIGTTDEIRVRFLFHAGRNDSSHPGWYLDDFSIAL